MKSVYLAGPITGLTFDGANDWRKKAINSLIGTGITGLSPLRCKDYLTNAGTLVALGNAKQDYEYSKLGVLSSARGIVTRDRFDCLRCDVLLVNFIGAKTVSIGTVMEIAWADSKRTPIVMAMEDDNVHAHGMLNEATGFRLQSIDEALEIVKAILK